MLVRKMLEFVKEWPQNKEEKQRIGLLASSRQQVIIYTGVFALIHTGTRGGGREGGREGEGWH